MQSWFTKSFQVTTGWWRRLTPFAKGLLFSLVLHVQVLVVLAMIFSFLLPRNQFETPLVFDFVFAPVDETDNASLEGSHKLHETSAQLPRLPERQHLAAPDISQVVDTPSLARQLAENPSRLPVSIESEPAPPAQPADPLDLSSRFVSEASAPPEETGAQSDNPFTVKTLTPSPLTTAVNRRSIRSAPPVKLALTKRQRRMFRKKFRKWTEDYYKMELPDSVYTWKDHGRTYSARFSRRPARSNTELDEVAVEVATVQNGVELTADLRMRRLAFSNFAQFVDHWDPMVAVHNDELDGRFHANSKINILDRHGVKPRFHGKVTTASFDVSTSGNRPFFDDKAVFLGGLETGVKAIALPRRFSPFLEDTTVTKEQIRAFDDETWITFRRNGTYTWRLKDSESIGTSAIPRTGRAFYLVGARKKKLHIRGVLHGRVLVYSPGKIMIDDDLTYARHPEVSAGSGDFLGIVSDRDIEISHPDITGPGDLNIYASIYAHRRFVVRHLGGTGDDTLVIYGSLTAGSLSATEPRYATRVQFDKRLKTVRPPSFPVSNRYDVTDWEAEWKVKSRRTERE